MNLTSILASLLVLCMGSKVLAVSEVPSEKSAKSEHDPLKYEKVVKQFHQTHSSRGDNPAWSHLGQGATFYAKGDYDEAIKYFGLALLGQSSDIQSQAHFNLANTLFQNAKFVGSKSAKDLDLEHIISILTESVEHYGHVLRLQPQHRDAAANKAAVEELIRKLKEQKQQQEQKSESNKPKSKPKDEGEGKQGDKPGEGKSDKGDDKGDQKGKGDQEGKGNEQGKGDQQGKGDEQGKGDQQGKGDEQGKGPGDKPKDGERTEAQKEADKLAEQASDQNIKGKKVEAMESKSKAKSTASKPSDADQKVNDLTGFSRTEARRNLIRNSDETSVRPRIEAPIPDRAFKNY